MTTAAESAAPAKIVRILNFMIFPQMVWRFRVLSGAHYLQAGCADSQNPLMHPWAKPLPVYPDQRTSADWPGMSEKVTAQVLVSVYDRRRDLANSEGFWAKASMMVQPCFLAVERKERMTAKSVAPSRERKPPDIFCRSFIMRPSRSA